jgi:RNA polymerase sigma-70 factor, ECF subfamily
MLRVRRRRLRVDHMLRNGVRRGYDGSRVLQMTAVADTEAAWHELRGPLTRFIARRMADPNDAEDVLQEVMLRVHRHGDQLTSADNVAAWVHGIARNAIIDHHRRRAARPEVPAGGAADLGEREAEPLEPGDSEAVQRELSACLRPLIERLPDTHRQALILSDLEGITQVETARRLGISASAAKARVQRGRTALRSLLLDCCHVELDRRGGITEYRARHGSCERCRTTT